ncbi:hypothetical protein I4U23_014963 [Adineta vaga]|nr:hypothetical protein I4U23_014963 [Adineta vaga]
MLILVYSSLLLFLNFPGSFQFEDGSLCAGKNVTSEPVQKFCEEQGGSIIHRCCRANDNATFIAVDLTELNLTTVPDFSPYTNFNLTVIDFRLNPQLEPSEENDFLTLTSLDDLILPEQFDCPGEYRVWNIIENITDPPGRRCRQQKLFCENSTDVCVEPSSYCSTNGPNHFLCLCDDAFHGYKCLRKGNFPLAAFFGTTGSVTFVASILLYWTQRRHVKS